MIAKKIRLMIAEDHHIARSALLNFLRKRPNFEVVAVATDGQSAVEQALHLKPDLILMDIGMPSLTGIEATRRIKVDLPDCRVLIVSAYEDEERVIAALAAGANGYCTKSTPGDELELAILSVITGGIWLDGRVGKGVVDQATRQQANEVINGSNAQDYGLTTREKEVLRLLIDGCSNTQIAEALFIGQETVKTHVSRIIQKLMVSRRSQAALKAIREGVIE